MLGSLAVKATKKTWRIPYVELTPAIHVSASLGRQCVATQIRLKRFGQVSHRAKFDASPLNLAHFVGATRWMACERTGS
jgi:hypothetical protein